MTRQQKENEEKKKKKKKNESIIEKELFSIMEHTLRACMEQAMKDLFKGFK